MSIILCPPICCLNPLYIILHHHDCWLNKKHRYGIYGIYNCVYPIISLHPILSHQLYPIYPPWWLFCMLSETISIQEGLSRQNLHFPMIFLVCSWWKKPKIRPIAKRSTSQDFSVPENGLTSKWLSNSREHDYNPIILWGYPIIRRTDM